MKRVTRLGRISSLTSWVRESSEKILYFYILYPQEVSPPSRCLPFLLYVRCYLSSPYVPDGKACEMPSETCPVSSVMVSCSRQLFVSSHFFVDSPWRRFRFQVNFYSQETFKRKSTIETRRRRNVSRTRGKELKSSVFLLIYQENSSLLFYLPLGSLVFETSLPVPHPTWSTPSLFSPSPFSPLTSSFLLSFYHSTNSTQGSFFSFSFHPTSAPMYQLFFTNCLDRLRENQNSLGELVLSFIWYFTHDNYLGVMSYQIDQGNICFATSVDREKVRKEKDVGVYTRICSMFYVLCILVSQEADETCINLHLIIITGTTMSTTRQRLTPTISVLSCCIGGSRCSTLPYVLCRWQGRLLFISFVSFVKRKSDTPFHDFLPSSHPLCSSCFVLIYFSSRHQISKSIYEKKKQSWYWE